MAGRWVREWVREGKQKVADSEKGGLVRMGPQSPEVMPHILSPVP
jgi:hypothetical protein